MDIVEGFDEGFLGEVKCFVLVLGQGQTFVIGLFVITAVQFSEGGPVSFADGVYQGFISG